ESVSHHGAPFGLTGRGSALQFPAQLGHERGVLAHLVAELLIHADKDRIGGFDVSQRKRELLADPLARADGPAGCQHLEDDARLLYQADQLAHPGAVLAQVDLSQRGVTELPLEFLSPATK